MNNSRRASTLGLLAASLIIGTLMASVALPATAAELKQLDLIASNQGTVLKLHTDQALPVTVQQAHYNRLVLTVADAGERSTILTNFAQAPNVDHVIIKRLPHHQVEITVLGHRLSEPRILFSLSPSIAAATAKAPLAPTVTVATATTTTSSSSSSPATAGVVVPTTAASLEPSLAPSSPAEGVALPPAASVTEAPLPVVAAAADRLSGWTFPAISLPSVDTEAVKATVTAQWVTLQPSLAPLLPYGVTALLLAGLGVFLWKKARQLAESQAMAHAVDAPGLPALRAESGSTISAAKLNQAKSQKAKAAGVAATGKKSGKVTLPPAPVLAYGTDDQQRNESVIGSAATRARQAMASYQGQETAAKQSVKGKAGSIKANSLGVTRPTVSTTANLGGGGNRSALSAVAQGATNPDIQAFLEAVASQMGQDDRPALGKTLPAAAAAAARFVAD